MRDLETASHFARMRTAEQWRIIAEVLAEAAEVPEPWVGPDPTLDPLWKDPRGRGVAAVRAERRDIAVRAAAADIAVRLQLSETTVRTRAHHADVLRERCPKVWKAFQSGDVPEANATITAQLAGSLPDEDPAGWAVFDEQVTGPASGQAPGRFRTRARVIRERVHAESIDTRHRRAAADRGVWVTPELDGMATLTAILPATGAHRLMGRLNAAAHHLHTADREERTLAQLRADVLADLVPAAGAEGDGQHRSGDGRSGSRHGGSADRGVSVAITVPALTLLGRSDEPATLDGYGPIDTDTARRLAGSATSWIRVLTHPVTGTVLDVDRKTYRVPADLRRWVQITQPVCQFPGCGRPARDCDLDHRIDWQYGGPTSVDNLGPSCEPHHIVRHGSNWTLRKTHDRTRWTSPTGRESDVDPPPF